MTASFLTGNIALWSLQIAILAAVAATLPSILGMKTPQSRLVFWNIVLLACLALPAISPSKQDALPVMVTASTTIISAGANPGQKLRFPISPDAILLLLAGIGILVRAGLLLLGFLRLRRFRAESEPLSPPSPWGVEADLRIAPEVTGPVTFGFRKPVVLLPQTFHDLSGDMQDAILCHEILHVRRHDWIFTLGEESIRAALWFHPAIWWLLRQIQLAREQTVDREAVEMTGARDRYIDALLMMAGAPQRDLAPAPLFLRRRQLKQRIASILQEVRVSTLKSVSAFAAGVTLLAASCWLVTIAFPLHAAPQTAPDPAGVSVDVGGAELLHRDPVPYPPDAIAKGIQGTVVADLKLDAAGAVTDATIVSGPEELRKAVLESVLNWHFSPGGGAASTQEVTATFVLPAPAAQTVQVTAPGPAAAGLVGAVQSIRIIGLSDQARDQLMAQLPISVGEMLTFDKFARLVSAVHAFDSHLEVSLARMYGTETAITISVGPLSPAIAVPSSNPAAIRVEPEAQSANVLTQVKPIYPPLAKQARVQGKVSFDATIGKDGHVEDLKLITGPPLLVQSAMEAVRQWIYKPTLVNGNPMEVATTITVNYTLLE